MDTIKMTESMINGLGKPKDARYQTNLQPTVPIAIIEVHGELMNLKMDCFSKHDEAAGSFAFEVLDGIKTIASGKAEFSLNTTDIKSVCFSNVANDAEQDVISSFVTKCILLLNEFNYAEWKNKVLKRGGKRNTVKFNTKKNYKIDISKAALLKVKATTTDDLLEMLRNEKRSFKVEKKISSRAETDQAQSPTEKMGDNNEQDNEKPRSYIRRTASWYVRGQYDQYGHYHPFKFKISKIPVGEDYADYRV